MIRPEAAHIAVTRANQKVRTKQRMKPIYIISLHSSRRKEISGTNVGPNFGQYSRLAEDNVGRTVRSKDKAQPVGPGFSTKIPPAKRIRKLVNDNLGLSLNGLRRTRNATSAHKARGSLKN